MIACVAREREGRGGREMEEGKRERERDGGGKEREIREGEKLARITPARQNEPQRECHLHCNSTLNLLKKEQFYLTKFSKILIQSTD